MVLDKRLDVLKMLVFSNWCIDSIVTIIKLPTVFQGIWEACSKISVENQRTPGKEAGRGGLSSLG